MIARLRILSLLLFLPLVAIPSRADENVPPQSVRIGVAAINGNEDALRTWSPLAAELETALAGTKFSIVPLSYGDVEKELQDNKVDFLLLGPAYYVDLEVRRGISRLATLVRSTKSGPLHSLGGVVLTRADRKDITTPLDLSGKTISATGELALGGWLSVMQEFRQLGLDRKSFKKVLQAPTYEDAVMDVQEGNADAAFVRTGTLEQLIEDGRIAPSEMRVLRFASTPTGFPLAISTRAYPEWAFAKALNTSDLLAKRVAVALLSLPPRARLKKTAGIEGFTVPLDYAPVHDLLRAHKLGPYALNKNQTMLELLEEHAVWVMGGGLLLLVFSAAAMGMAMINRRLAQSRLDMLRLRDQLEHTVSERTRDLEAEVERRKQAELDRKEEAQRVKVSLVQTVKAVALTVEMRDPYMSGHQQRVAVLAKAIAQEMKLAPDVVECIYLAGLVHDIGMIYVPSEITNRPGPLSDLEFEIVKSHPLIGCEIMSTVDLPWPIAQAVLNHHRFLDGEGYPQKPGEDIPLESRVLCVADIVEAMCSHRPYRPPLPLEKALAFIDEGRGVRFDAEVVDACKRVMETHGVLIWQ